MVHVQQRALRALGEDRLALGQRVVQEGRRVGHVRVDLLVELDVLVHDGVHVEALGAVDGRQDVVLLLDGRGQLLAEAVAVEQVHDPDAGPRELVDVRRADPAPGGADGLGVAPALLGLIERLVVGHDEVGVVADLEPPGDRVPERLDLTDLVHQRLRVDHDPVADHAGRALVEDARRDQVEHERLIAPLDGVAGVRAALVAGDDVHGRREEVDDLPLAFVAPLGADDDGNWHVERASGMGHRARGRRPSPCPVPHAPCLRNWRRPRRWRQTTGRRRRVGSPRGWRGRGRRRPPAGGRPPCCAPS